MAGGSLVNVKAREKQVGLQDEVPSLDGRMRKKAARNAFAKAGRIVHHILWQYHQEISRICSKRTQTLRQTQKCGGKGRENLTCG
jgi:hypothetical protein